VRISGPLDDSQLQSAAAEVVSLLATGNFATLADRFGYALARGRDKASAIEADLAVCLAEIGSRRLVGMDHSSAPLVKHYRQNPSRMHASVECVAETQSGGRILVELVVTGSGAERHIGLEQMSVMP